MKIKYCLCIYVCFSKLDGSHILRFRKKTSQKSTSAYVRTPKCSRCKVMVEQIADNETALKMRLVGLHIALAVIKSRKYLSYRPFITGVDDERTERTHPTIRPKFHSKTSLIKTHNYLHNRRSNASVAFPKVLRKKCKIFDYEKFTFIPIVCLVQNKHFG